MCRRVVVLAVAILASGSLVSCTQNEPPPVRRETTPPGLGSAKGDALLNAGAIAFISMRDGLQQVFSIDPAGGEAVAVTDETANHIHPAWSPDGTEIAFVRAYGDINAVDLDIAVLGGDGEIRPITGGATRDVNPSWSPDGKKLVFESARAREPQLDVVPTDGGAARHLGVGPRAYAPAWSPDGKWIAFAGRVPGCKKLPTMCEQHIFIMRTNGSRPRQLTAGHGHNGEPAWSPDGREIAYSSNGSRASGDNFDIYVMDEDGTNGRRLTDTAELDLGAAWSPDGSSIAFASQRDGDFEIYVMDADGRGQRNLTNTPKADEYTPTWRDA